MSDQFISKEETNIPPERAGRPLISVKIQDVDALSIDFGNALYYEEQEDHSVITTIPFTRFRVHANQQTLPMMEIRDAEGLPIEQTYWTGQYHNATAQLAVGPTGYTTVKTSYDEKSGRVSALHYFDTNGNPCMAYDDRFATKEKYSSIKFSYLPGFPEVTGTCFDTSGKETESFDVQFSDQDRYYAGHPFIPLSEKNEQGQILKEWYADTNGTPCYGKEGYHMRRIKYNDIGLICEEEFLDTDIHPINDISGRAKIIHKYIGEPKQKNTSYKSYSENFDKNGEYIGGMGDDSSISPICL